MSTSGNPTEAPRRRPLGRFLAVFALVALLVAGGVSYLASSSPDGLDSATLQGCTETADGTLEGTCIAQNAEDHALEESTPLAGYALGGDEGLTGLAGIIGVVAVFAAAGGLFWLLARSRRRRGSHGSS